MKRAAAARSDTATAAAAHRLPPGLEERIAALEAASGQAKDFDARSWAWLVLLGVVLPILLLVIGWWL